MSQLNSSGVRGPAASFAGGQRKWLSADGERTARDRAFTRSSTDPLEHLDAGWGFTGEDEDGTFMSQQVEPVLHILRQRVDTMLHINALYGGNDIFRHQHFGALRTSISSDGWEYRGFASTLLSLRSLPGQHFIT